MVPRVPIGIDDFRQLREAGLEYVDKSDLIRALLDRAGVEAVLLPRPRRFGKTLNLSTLRCWFEKRSEDLSHLFRDLSIWQAGDEYRAHFQALAQLQTRDHAAELRASGAAPVFAFALAFDGKEVRVRAAGAG